MLLCMGERLFGIETKMTSEITFTEINLIMAVDITGLNFFQLRTNIVSLWERQVIPRPSHAEWSILRGRQYV